MRPIRASSPARARSRIDGCAPSRARRLLRLGTPRIPICFVRPTDPGSGASSPARARLRTKGCAPSRARRLPKPESTASSWHLGRVCGLSPRPPEQTRILARRRPEPEAAGTNSHLGRGGGRSGRRLLRALGHASADALPRVLVASCGSARPASQSASFVRRPRAPGASSPARARSRIDGCAPSRARRLLRLGTPRIPICVVRPVDPGFLMTAAQTRPVRPSRAGTLRRGVEEVLAYWELTTNLIARDLKTKYRGSVLGVFWSLLNPLLLMLVYTVVFSKIARVPIPRYPVFLLAV